MEQNRKPRYKPTHIWPINMIKEPWVYIGEMTASSTTGVGKLDSYMQENETELLSNSIHKSKLEMDQRSECKSWNHKTVGKQQAKSPEYKHEQLFPECISSCKGNKIKNEQMGRHHAKKLLYSKGHHQKSKKASYSMGEYIHKWQIWWGLTLKIYKELTHLNKQKHK